MKNLKSILKTINPTRKGKSILKTTKKEDGASCLRESDIVSPKLKSSLARIELIGVRQKTTRYKSFLRIGFI